MYSTPLCVIVKKQEQWGELTRGKMVECGSWSVDFHDRYLFLFFKGHLGSTVVETLTTWSMATGRTQRLGIMRQASHTCIWFWLQIHRIDWEQKDTHLANNSWWLLSGLPQAPEIEPVRNTFFICLFLMVWVQYLFLGYKGEALSFSCSRRNIVTTRNS